MGRIDTFVDPTGNLSSVEVNAQNIQQIIEELNRNSDQLDALGNNLAIVSRGTLTLQLNGNQYNGAAQLGTTVPASYLAFMTRPDMPGQYFTIPYFNTQGVPVTSLNMVIAASLNTFGDLKGQQMELSFGGIIATGYAAPSSINIYYYIFSQPINPTKT